MTVVYRPVEKEEPEPKVEVYAPVHNCTDYFKWGYSGYYSLHYSIEKEGSLWQCPDCDKFFVTVRKGPSGSPKFWKPVRWYHIRTRGIIANLDVDSYDFSFSVEEPKPEPEVRQSWSDQKIREYNESGACTYEKNYTSLRRAQLEEKKRLMERYDRITSSYITAEYISIIPPMTELTFHEQIAHLYASAERFDKERAAREGELDVSDVTW